MQALARLRAARQALIYCRPARWCSSAPEHALLSRQQPVEGQAEASVAILSMNRPKARNAFNRALVMQFSDAVETLRFDPAVRAVIIRSATATMFSAGADLKERSAMNEHEVAAFIYSLRSLFTAIELLPMPTLACIEGPCLGGGLELALACDIRLAGLTETSLAILPGAGGTQRLPRLIGEAKAKELIFTARRLSGIEAKDMGIVNEVVAEGDLLDRALALCTTIASNGPVAVKQAKLAIHQGLQVDLTTGLEIEKACYAQLIPTQDRLEGLKAFKEKRKPTYLGR